MKTDHDNVVFNAENNGIGVLGALGVVFVTLKLVDIIDWSWWYVTLPFWGGFAVLILMIVIYFFVHGIGLLFTKFK